MRDLSVLREGWEAIEVEETRLLRTLTVQGGVRQRLNLKCYQSPAGRWSIATELALSEPVNVGRSGAISFWATG